MRGTIGGMRPATAVVIGVLLVLLLIAGGIQIYQILNPVG